MVNMIHVYAHCYLQLQNHTSTQPTQLLWRGRGADVYLKIYQHIVLIILSDKGLGHGCLVPGVHGTQWEQQCGMVLLHLYEEGPVTREHRLRANL